MNNTETLQQAINWWASIGEETANELRSKHYPTQFVVTHEQIKKIWEKETKPSCPTDNEIDEAIIDLSREQMEKFTYSKERMQPIIEGYRELLALCNSYHAQLMPSDTNEIIIKSEQLLKDL